MGLHIEYRPSDSPYIERVWRSHSDEIDKFISIAVSQWDLVVWKEAGKTYSALQGPETQASSAPVPPNTEFFGILFKVGTFMPHLPVNTLINSNVTLPDANANAFWLKGAAWEYPNFDNAETFVNRLVRQELLVREPLVNDIMAGHQPDLSLRTVQRRFLNATGLTNSTIQQIERARQATIMLQQGVSILDTVHNLGYFDQPHLARSLKHFIGQTATQLADHSKTEQMSLLYQTT